MLLGVRYRSFRRRWPSYVYLQPPWNICASILNLQTSFGTFLSVIVLLLVSSLAQTFFFYLSFPWVSRWSKTVPGGAQARPEKKKTSPRMNEWLNKIKWMYCNIQWVELLSHHQPIHYTERERERIWHEVDSEQDRGEGRSWEALKELHLFEEWLSCRGASDDEERWLRCCFFENLLAPRTTGKAKQSGSRAGRQSQS